MNIIRNNEIFTGKYKGIFYSKENPLWTENLFDGAPPDGYLSWGDWIEDSTNKGLFKGVKITVYITNQST